MATHNRDTKQTTEHKKERPKTQPQDLSCPSKIAHPISKRLVPGAGDCASLVCRFVTARLPVSRIWSHFSHCGHLFGRATMMSPEIPLLWVVKISFVVGLRMALKLLEFQSGLRCPQPYTLSCLGKIYSEHLVTRRYHVSI
jgi:hypothetical protein